MQKRSRSQLGYLLIGLAGIVGLNALLAREIDCAACELLAKETLDEADLAVLLTDLVRRVASTLPQVA